MSKKKTLKAILLVLSALLTVAKTVQETDKAPEPYDGTESVFNAEGLPFVGSPLLLFRH